MCVFMCSVSLSTVLLCVLCACVHMLSQVPLCDPVDCTLQDPLSVEFPRQEQWSRLPFPSPGVLPNPGIEPTSLVSPALAGRFFTTVPPGKQVVILVCL